MPSHDSSSGDVTVVLGTRNRRDNAVRTVQRLRELPDHPAMVVVDDASVDDTAAAIRSAFPDVRVIRLERHGGVTGARNAGVEAATTPFVAFADDDSWWAPGALTVAVQRFNDHPRLGLLAARIVVGDEARLDPACIAMAASPLPSDGLPGPRVLGFIACGTVVRREAFLGVGGFHEEYVIMGEEEPLALALAASEWDLAYVDEVVAHHAPGTAPRDPAGRQRNQIRNDLWTAWRYRPASGALLRTAEILRGVDTRAKLTGVFQALGRLPCVLASRRPIPPHVEEHRRMLAAR